MKISGTLDLAGLEYVADQTALDALTDLFDGRIVNMNGTVCIYNGGWLTLAAGDASVPPVTGGTTGQILRSNGSIAGWADQYPAGTVGKFLQTDGSGNVSWQDPPATLPAQDTDPVTGTIDKVLLSDGTSASWGDVPRASLEAGTADRVLINDGSGDIDEVPQLPPELGGLGADASGFSGIVKASAGTFTAAALLESELPDDINAEKIADGSVDNDAFQRIAGLTSDAQDQLDAKLSLTGGTLSAALYLPAASPVGATEAVHKSYVDNVASGLKVKNSVVVAADTNLTLSGEQTVDGVALVTGDRVLCMGQSTQANRGIYRVEIGAWGRTTDANAWDELVSAFCFVETGSYQDCGFVCTVNQGGTLGVTAVTFSQFSGAGTYTAGPGLDITASIFSAKFDAGGTILSSGSGPTEGLKVSDTVALVTPTVSQHMTFAPVAAPSAPGTGTRVFGGVDGKVYKISAGDSAASVVGGGLVTELKSTTFTAVQGYHYLCNTGTAGFTATLPAGTAGAVIRFSDDTRTWATKYLTIAPATGESIGSLAANETVVCDLSGAYVQLAWDGTRWVLDTPGYAANVNSGIGLADSAGNAGLVNPYTAGSGVVYSARYTPTLAASTNVSAATGFSSHYARNGKIVTVSGFCTVSATNVSNDASVLFIPLPIASNLSSFGDAAGTFVRSAASGSGYSVGYIGADTTPGNNRVQVFFNNVTTGLANCTFQFQYEIK